MFLPKCEEHTRDNWFCNNLLAILATPFAWPFARC
jgi:hypothetical protein